VSASDLIQRGRALLEKANDFQSPWLDRARAFSQGSDLLMDAVTISDDVHQVDWVLYVGDGIVSTPLLWGEYLQPPSLDLIDTYLWLTEAHLELFEFRMRVTDLREAARCRQTAYGLQSLRGEEDATTTLRCTIARARAAAYYTETFGQAPPASIGPDVNAAVEELRLVAGANVIAIVWLARCLRLAAGQSSEPERSLREAVRLLLDVLNAPLPRTRSLPWLQAAWAADLSRCQLDIAALTGQHSDLNIAFNWARQALATQSASPAAASAFARAHRALVASPLGIRIEDVERQHSGLIMLDGRTWHGWLASREHAAWCRDTGLRLGVAQARYVYDIALEVASWESSAVERSSWLRQIAELAPLVTDRLFIDESPDAAGFRLERARTTTLRQRFADEYTELRDVTAAGHGALAADLREALDASRSESLGERAHQLAASRVTRLSQQLRGISGFERFGKWLEPDEVSDAAGDELLVYLLPGPSGGWAVGYDPGAGWFQERLPMCRTDAIPLPVRRFHSMTRNLRLPVGARRRAVKSISAWLWAAVYEPLRCHLASRTCHVVAHGYLAGLPIHAARLAPETGCSAIFECDLRYVPSAGALAESRRSLKLADPYDQVFLGVPPPEDAGLAGAQDEMRTVKEWFPRAVILGVDERSPDAVVRAAQTAGWLHASCHGVADSNDPLNSGLLLSGGQRLTVRDLARGTTGHLTLAVLSACQTAVADPELPEEELSLAAGFLSAGCGAVIASTWPVPDRATGALMAWFYREWRQDGRTPAEALGSAQRRLAGGASLSYESAWRDPYCWAAFRYLGW
jgi:hypothetical protein